ncbi:TATA-box-binding protein [Candidatus Bathyarchaeota archaeon]|nr:TATA-box-binding protein [Candidatus Bathyarchaeota archaeon]
MNYQEPSIEIKNVVASGDLKQQLDLETILKFSQGAAYRPQEFPGIIYRLRKPRTSVLIFNSGKIICTGAKSEKDAKKAIIKIVEEFKRNGLLILNQPKIEVQNIVATGDLSGRIDLEKTAFILKRTIYEPDQFPALIYRMEKPEVSALLFASGKIVCAGAKNEKEVKLAIIFLSENLEKEGAISHENLIPENSKLLKPQLIHA